MFHQQFLVSDIFSVFLKYGACYITGQWSDFRVKNAFTYFHILFWHCFVVFRHKICVFVISIAFFDKLSNFRNTIFNQSESRIGERQLVRIIARGTLCFSLTFQQKHPRTTTAINNFHKKSSIINI